MSLALRRLELDDAVTSDDDFLVALLQKLAVLFGLLLALSQDVPELVDLPASLNDLISPLILDSGDLAFVVRDLGVNLLVEVVDLLVAALDVYQGSSVFVAPLVDALFEFLEVGARSLLSKFKIGLEIRNLLLELGDCAGFPTTPNPHTLS